MKNSKDQIEPIQQQQPEQPPMKFHVKRKDYNKIKHWYQLAIINQSSNNNENNCDALASIPSLITQKSITPPKYNFTKENKSSNISNHSQLHYRFYFDRILLEEKEIHKKLNRFSKIHSLSIFANIYRTSIQCFIGKPYEKRQIQATFSLESRAIILKEEINYFFYMFANKYNDTELVFQIQMMTTNGLIYKLGTIKHSLMIKKNAGNLVKFVLKNEEMINENESNVDNKMLSEIKADIMLKVQRKGQSTIVEDSSRIGYIDAIGDVSWIDSISKYLPDLVVFDQHALIPPFVSWNIKLNDTLTKQKQIGNQIILRNATFHIQKWQLVKSLLLKMNPFTHEHKELISLQIISYEVIIGNHNSWKIINQPQSQQSSTMLRQQDLSSTKIKQKQRLRFTLDVISEKDDEVYLTSSALKSLKKCYYQQEQCELLAILICHVQYHLQGQVISADRAVTYTLGWLPIIVHLTEKLTDIDMLMIDDVPLPGFSNQLTPLKCHFTCSVEHTNHTKFKKKPQDRDVRQFDHLIVDENHQKSSAVRKITFKTNKRITETSISNELNSQNYSKSYDGRKSFTSIKELDNKLQILTNIASRYFTSKPSKILVSLNFKLQSARTKTTQNIDKKSFQIANELKDVEQDDGELSEINKADQIAEDHLLQGNEQDMWHRNANLLKGKCFTLTFKPKSIIPACNQNESYYIPSKWKIVVYAFRQQFEIKGSIQEIHAQPEIPLKITSSQEGILKVILDTPEEVLKLASATFIIFLYDLDTYILYAKGKYPCSYFFQNVSISESLIPKSPPKTKAEQTKSRIIEIELFDPTSPEKVSYGILSCEVTTSFLEIKSSTSKIQEIQKDKMLSELPIGERQKLRINTFNHKDSESKNDAIKYYKQKTQNEYLSKVVNEQYNNSMQVFYEPGIDTYCLVQFDNTFKSQGQWSKFICKFDTNHAEIVCNHKEQTQIMVRYRLPKYNLSKNISMVPHQESTTQSLQQYQFKMLFNQTIALLLKINIDLDGTLNQSPIRVIQATFKKDGVETVKSIKIKCKGRRSILSDAHHLYYINPHPCIMNAQTNVNKRIEISLNRWTIHQNTRWSHVLNKDWFYDNQTNCLIYELDHVFWKTKRISICMVAFEDEAPATSIHHKQQTTHLSTKTIPSINTKIVLFEIDIVHGECLNLYLGEVYAHHLIIPKSVGSSHILLLKLSHSKAMAVDKSLAMIGCELGKLPTLKIRCMQLGNQLQFLVTYVNLEGQVQYQYLFQCNCKINRILNVINVQNMKGCNFKFICENPYPIQMKFALVHHDRSIHIRQSLFQLAPYSKKVVVGEIVTLNHQDTLLVLTDADQQLIELYNLHRIVQQLDHSSQHDIDSIDQLQYE